jgi:hypothetical protein
MADEVLGKSEAVAQALGNLWWLVDAPLFIDSDLVRRLHQAYVWPDLQQVSVERSEVERVKDAVSQVISGGAGLELKLPWFLGALGPKASAKLEGSRTDADENESTKGSTTRGALIESSERHLHALAVEYLQSYPDRILFVDAPGGQYRNFEREVSPEEVQSFLDVPPRPLVFMDIKPESAIFPTMAEMEEGGFKPIFLDLDKKFLSGLEPAPSYPRDDDPDADRKRAEYWGALKGNFSSRAAMQEIEKAGEEARIGWIDFRILFKEGGQTAHLHVVPAGRYHTGVFGYNFVHRGFRFGCRIVGSLKSGNDLNVLAIYEK